MTSMAPDIVQARREAELFLERNEPNDWLRALEKLQRCFKAAPHDVATLRLLARAFDLGRQPEKAAAVRDEIALLAQSSAPIDDSIVVQVAISPIETALEAADAFIAHGRADEAIRVIREQLAVFPDHPLLLERLDEISF